MHMPEPKGVWAGTLAVFFAVAIVSRAQDNTPAPGTINWIEGHVTIDGQAVPSDVSEDTAVTVGHVLQTDQGKAEILLTPGVFLRVAENSAVKMEALSDRDVKVELVRGEALVEVAQVDPRRRLDLVDNGAEARLEHDGLYLFNASRPAVAVHRGRTRVEDDRRAISLGHGEELPLSGEGALKPRKFGRTETDPLYAWSLQRADYDARTSEWTVEGLLALGDASSYPAGWYWNPWYRAWAFVPASGYRLSPFGYGFYAVNTPQSRTPVFGDFR